MAAAKTLLAVALLSVSAVVIPQTSDQKARDLLAKSMELGRRIALTGVVKQRMLAGSETMYHLRIEQGEGKVRLTVLSPLSYQGVTTLDDGKRWTTFLPDENRLLIQPSPRLSMGDPKQRMKLASQNYRFRLERGEPIAGRQTVVVIAEPKAPIPTRRYVLDEKTSVMLRLENVGPLAERRLLFDTAEIAFPNAVGSNVFSLHTVGGVRKVEFEAPINFTSDEMGQRLVGFVPIRPKKLPFGFTIQECQVTGPKDGRFFAIRLTDGLVSATVYQWDARRQNHSLPGDYEGWSLRVNRIELRIAGEITEDLGESLIEAFDIDEGDAP